MSSLSFVRNYNNNDDNLWIRWAEESTDLACKWAYEGVEAGITLSGKPNQSNIV